MFCRASYIVVKSLIRLHFAGLKDKTLPVVDTFLLEGSRQSMMCCRHTQSSCFIVGIKYILLCRTHSKPLFSFDFFCFVLLLTATVHVHIYTKQS